MKKWIIIMNCGILLAALALASASNASPSVFDLPWWTVDGGGGFSQGGDYGLSYSIGQPDAGILSNGSYTLEGGFGPGGELPSLTERVYLPLVIR
jgi:hypothetical protein